MDLNKALLSSDSNEWYTPLELIQGVRHVLGEIDLDPASNWFANKIVRANRYYDKTQDALKLSWVASTVFLNPPYGKVGSESRAGVFTEYALNQWSAGNFESGMILLKAAIGYNWFSDVVREVDHVVFLDEIPKFYNPSARKKGKAKLGAALFLLSDNREVINRFYNYYNGKGFFKK